MPYVIAEPCIDVKDASCVDVCPVDCIATTDDSNQYFIDPEACIDCGACEPACPVNAIFEQGVLPAEWQQYVQLNSDFYQMK